MYVCVARHRPKLYIKVVDICHTQINIYLDRQCSELEYLKTRELFYYLWGRYFEYFKYKITPL